MKKLRIVLLICALLCALTLIPFNTFAANEPSTTTIGGETYYEIESVDHLEWFRDEVNSGNNDINAILTVNLQLNSNVLDANGELKGSGYEVWEPIGNYKNSTTGTKYIGTFDGNGKTISGLYYNDSADNINNKFIGLFGYIGESATVKNLTISDSYLNGYSSIGSISGDCDGIITGCTNKSTIKGQYNIGGIAGALSDGAINNCINSGNLYGYGSVGGIVGYGYDNITITNSYNNGTIIGQNEVGGILGGSGNSTTVTIEYCYNIGTIVARNDIIPTNQSYKYFGGIVGDVYNNSKISHCFNSKRISYTVEPDYFGGIVGRLSNSSLEDVAYAYGDFLYGYHHNSTIKDFASFSESKFTSGEVAYWLNKHHDSPIWYQNIGTDSAPSLDSSKGTVYLNKLNCKDIEYSNTKKTDNTSHVSLEYRPYEYSSFSSIEEYCSYCGHVATYNLRNDELIYDGNEKSARITFSGTAVATSYVSYSGNRVNVTNEGFTATLHFGDKTVSRTYKIEPKELKDSDITLEYSEIAYDGSEKKPSVVVMSDGVMLVSDTDYELTYRNNVSVGNATVSVKGIGNYKNTVNVTFRIKDTIAPTGKIIMGSDFWNNFRDTFIFDLFFKDSVTVTVEASDIGTSVKTVEYLLSDTPLSESDLSSASFINIAKINGDYKVEIPAAKKGAFYAKITDQEGNITFINSDGAVIYNDSAAVTEQIEYTYKENSDKEIELSLNSNSVKNVKRGAFELIIGTDYEVSGEKIILKKEYLDTLKYSETPYEFTVSYYPLDVETSLVDITTTFKVKVNKAQLTLNSVTLETKKYDGTNSVKVLTADFSGRDPSDNVGIRISELTAYLDGKNVGTYDKVYIDNITIYSDDAENYKIDSSAVLDMNVVINKADAPTLSDILLSANFDKTDFTAEDLAKDMPQDAGKLTYSAQTATVIGNAIVNTSSVDENGVLSFTISKGTIGDKITVPVKISSENYEDAVINTVLTLKNSISIENEVTKDDVTKEDEEQLLKDKEVLEKLLSDNEDVYGENEKEVIEKELNEINEALKALENIENAEDKIGALPDEITLSDKEALEKAKEAFDNLSDYEKSLVSKEVKEKLEAAIKNAEKSPNTSDSTNLSVYILMLLSSLSLLLFIKRKVKA